jgi:hypothetical protein
LFLKGFRVKVKFEEESNLNRGLFLKRKSTLNRKHFKDKDMNGIRNISYSIEFIIYQNKELEL